MRNRRLLVSEFASHAIYLPLTTETERGSIEPRGDIFMQHVKTLADWMSERGLDLADLVARSGLEQRVVEAIACGRYTPSPQQRQRLASALSVSTEEVVWGHLAPVEHVQGHGPQFGRSP
jgi:ribosome-binding protein aMBF1 (putative translation factor)